MEHSTTLSPEEIASCSARKPECDLQTNLEEALLKIAELEKENAELKKETEKYHSDRYIILDKKRDDFLPKMKYEFTMDDWNRAAERFSEGLKKSCENLPKVEPASPKSIAEAKKIISDALNAPLDIEDFGKNKKNLN